jgi:hypothetical protein
MDAPPRLKPWAIFRFSLRETSGAGVPRGFLARRSQGRLTPLAWNHFRSCLWEIVPEGHFENSPTF